MKESLEKRKKALEDEFAALDQERQKQVEQRKLIDQRLSQIQTRQVQLQGSYQEIDTLLKEETKPVELKNAQKAKSNGKEKAA